MTTTDFFDDDIGIDPDEDLEEGGENAAAARGDAWRLDKRWALFMNPRLHGSCFNPWQFLKVDNFARMNVCCSFFERLMKFEWPTAAEFHGENSTWNHPFMQHLRSSMGDDDEVPYCGFCQGRQRDDLPMRTSRKLAAIASQQMFQDKLDEAAPFQYAGGIARLGDALPDWTLERKSGGSWKPFKATRQSYRRDVRMAGFQNIGRVLQLGCAKGALSPFLAEAANDLTLVDWREAELGQTRDLLDALDLGAARCVALPVQEPSLPFANQSFDGVWLDGRRWFERFERGALLREIGRLLKPEGRLRIVLAAGPGALARAAVFAAAADEALRLCDILAQGGLYDGRNAFFAIETINGVMADAGFVIDKERPPQVRPIGENFREEPPLGRDTKALAAKLRDPEFRVKLRTQPDLLNGLEEYFTLTAFPVAAPRGRKL